MTHKKRIRSIFLILFMLLFVFDSNAEDGYRLWLRYDKISNKILLQQYRNKISGIQMNTNSATLKVAMEELFNGLFKHYKD
jgi:alpha-glucuronidase